MTAPPAPDALDKLPRELRLYSGDRLPAVYRTERNHLFGKVEKSDVGLAVVLADSSWRPLDEMRAFSRLQFDRLGETEPCVRAWPIAAPDNGRALNVVFDNRLIADCEPVTTSEADARAVATDMTAFLAGVAPCNEA